MPQCQGSGTVSNIIAGGWHMRGHDALIKMRMAGKTPASVTLYDFPIDTNWQQWGDIPRVCVFGDQIIDLDLRFVIGLIVSIESYDQKRASQLFAKSIEFGASIVASASHPSPKDDPYCKTPSTVNFFYRHYGGVNDNHHYA